MSNAAPVTFETERQDETDLILRHVSRRHPMGLARALVRTDAPLTDAEWAETQVTARQRRLDRALRLKVGGDPRLLHVEWTTELPVSMSFRVYEYHCLTALALEADIQAEAEQDRTRPKPEQRPPPIESVVVVLDGRETPLPAWGEYRTSPPEQKFSGVHYQIVAVYQRTVAELEAMGGVFWLVFVPLAKDVDEEKLVRVIERVRRETSEDGLDDMLSAMILLAQRRKRGPNVMNMLKQPNQEETITDRILNRFAHEVGFEKGIKKGLEQGIEQGIEKGIEKGIEQVLALTTSLIERRIGRPLRQAERNRVALRLRKRRADELGKVLLDSSPADLVAWLAPRKARAA